MKYTNNVLYVLFASRYKQGGISVNCIYASNIINNRIWPDFIAHFQSETTAASYLTDIIEIMNCFQKDFLQINDSDIHNYFSYMENKVKSGRLKPGTFAKKFRELHSFAEYICDNRERYGIKDDFQDEFYPFLKLVEKQEKYVRVIPAEHMDQLLQAAQENRMEYCILVLLYRAGLSSTEIISMKIKDLAEYENGVYYFSKKRKSACFIPEDAVDVLKQYIDEQTEREYVFCNKRGNPLNTMFISRMMKKYTEKMGLPTYSAESIRNTCGVNMFAYGAKSKQVAAQMGVSQMQIQRYHNTVYKDNLQKEGNSFVKIRVSLPK